MHLSNQAPGNHSRVLFFSACPDESSRFKRRTELPNLDQLLAALILQMLHWDNFLEENGHLVEGKMSGGVGGKIELLKDLLGVCKSSDELYILIDRIDGIRPSHDDDDSESCEDSVSLTLELILEIVGAASCTVRMVVVADASEWSKVRTDTDMEGRWKIWKRQIGLNKFSMVCKVGWNQAEIIHTEGIGGRSTSL